jgi:outer membrane usher protein
VGYTQGSNYHTLSANASGSLLLHEAGLTFANQLGETNALIEVPGISGLGMHNSPGGTTDSGGFMASPHLRPYRSNSLQLQTANLDPQIQIDNGSAQVVPRRGAIVKVRFAARKVTRLILTLQQSDGKPWPFGTQVSDSQGQTLAVVGQAGQALVATDHKAQALHLRWGQHTCQVHIDPTDMPLEHGYRLQTLQCARPPQTSPRT